MSSGCRTSISGSLFLAIPWWSEVIARQMGMMVEEDLFLEAVIIC